MKQSDLKRIIKEEIDRELTLNEGILDSLIMMFLSPKIKREANKLKDSPDWKELMQKMKRNKEEIEMYNDRFEKALKKCKEEQAKSKKLGLKVYPCFTDPNK